MSKRFTLTVTVTKVDWVNPHIVVFIDAQGGSGTESWKFESNPPAWFSRVGVGRVDFQKITLHDGSALELVNPDDVK